jgi:hypothetical protein
MVMNCGVLSTLRLLNGLANCVDIFLLPAIIQPQSTIQLGAENSMELEP